MHFEPADISMSAPDAPGVIRGMLRFNHPLLTPYAWPVCEIRGRAPGARLCVSAGVHVNEVSSIEAAIRLQTIFDPDVMRGSVSIMPLVNLPAEFKYTEYLCPVDDRNINFSFPGDPNGGFTDVLCDAIQNQWCSGADCYVDMHGGDLRENVSKFSMYQRTGNAERDAMRRRLANSFDADIVVGFDPSYLSSPGRPPTGFARQERIAIMSEAGANGVPDEASIDYHVNGVLNVARNLGILSDEPETFRRARVHCDGYLWVSCPASGLFYPAIEPAARVEKGQHLGQMRDYFGQDLADIVAPASGIILWRLTHPAIEVGTPVLAIAVPESAS